MTTNAVTSKTVPPALDIVQQLSMGNGAVIDYFYTYGDEHLLRDWVIEVLEWYAAIVESVALTSDHPSFKNWLSIYNLCSSAEVQEYSRRNPVPLNVRIDRC